uniref:G_PROTEIN_RECEP_F1_2 domain-containing protein n=1 Tax=Meloidogyne hapla TaxID=6305 RepID=A0A1I8BNM1_MELHA
MNQTQCIAAETSVLDTGYNIVRALHLTLGTIVLILLIRVVWSYKTKSVNLHKNLIIVLFTFSDPCDCLTQVWLVYLIRMPAYIYTFASPLFHLAIMIERVLATVYVKIYEKQGKMFGVISSIIVLLFIHAIITLIVYDYFLKKQSDINKYFIKKNMNLGSDIYFKKLKYAWK